MNLRLLFTLFCILSSNAFAGGLVLVRYAETEQAIHYFDSIQMRKMGDTAFVLSLIHI